MGMFLICRYRAVIDESGVIVDVDYGRRSHPEAMTTVEVNSVNVSHRYPFKATEWSVTGNLRDKDRVSAAFASLLARSARTTGRRNVSQHGEKLEAARSPQDPPEGV